MMRLYRFGFFSLVCNNSFFKILYKYIVFILYLNKLIERISIFKYIYGIVLKLIGRGACGLRSVYIVLFKKLYIIIFRRFFYFSFMVEEFEI